MTATTERIIPSKEHGCTGKANLGSSYEKQADHFAKKYGKTYGVYRCPHCNGTHLTTKIEIAEKYFAPLIYTAHANHNPPHTDMSKAHDYGEPWIANLDEWKSPITNESGEPILDNCEIGEQELVRIVKCVNACAGSPDPAAALTAAREIIETVENAMRRHYDLPSYLHNKCVEALNLLTPAP